MGPTFPPPLSWKGRGHPDKRRFLNSSVPLSLLALSTGTSNMIKHRISWIYSEERGGHREGEDFSQCGGKAKDAEAGAGP